MHGRCASRRAGISSPIAAWGSGRWPWRRSWAPTGRPPRPIATPPPDVPAPGRDPAAPGRSARGPAGAFPAAGEERDLSVHGRRPQPARAVRLQAPASRTTAASRSRTRSSRAGGSRSWTSFTKEHPKLLGTTRRFAQHGESGAWVSELLPHLAEVVDDLTFVKSAATDVFNHAPAKLFANTGHGAVRPAEHGLVGHLRDRQRVVEPARASWCCNRARAARAAGRSTGGAASCPRPTRACRSASGGEPILNLATPPGISRDRQRRTIEAIDALNRAHLDATVDPEIATRITCLRGGLPDADERTGADRPGVRDARDA